MLAAARETTPSSSSLRMRLSSSEKHALMDGAYNDEHISHAPLGQSAVSPSRAAELQQVLGRAATAPETFRRFYPLMVGKRPPEGVDAENVRTKDLQVRPELARECLAIIQVNGICAGVLKDWAGGTMVDYGVVRDRRAPPESSATDAADAAASVEGYPTAFSSDTHLFDGSGHAPVVESSR